MMYFSGKATLHSFVELFHIVSAGLTYMASKKPLFQAWDALGIMSVYILNLIILYTLR